MGKDTIFTFIKKLDTGDKEDTNLTPCADKEFKFYYESSGKSADLATDPENYGPLIFKVDSDCVGKGSVP